MKILNAEQLRAWDDYTIRNEPVASIDLMERAASSCVKWLADNENIPSTVTIFCGKGNNGGDGLAIARLLAARGCKVNVYILEFGNKGTADFQQNLERLHKAHRIEIFFIQSQDQFPVITGDLVIDALFGSGLSRPVTDLSADLIGHINNCGIPIISIDIPSGLFVDKSSRNNIAIKARHTLSFQSYKPAFLVSENAEYIGELHILDIGLHPAFQNTLTGYEETIDSDLIKGIYKPRPVFAHKGIFGHALLVVGSYGKMGAAVLATRACMRAGVGLVTAHIPASGFTIMQTAIPEAMLVADKNDFHVTAIDISLKPFNVIGIGPGIGTAHETHDMIRHLFAMPGKPLVLDADAINVIAMERELAISIPQNSILTPHPKEFERLFGKTENDFKRIELAKEQAAALNVIIVLKGHHTFIFTPGGRCYVNMTGNAGMATAGSGDVLTGILTSLLAQGYDPVNAAVLGVYLHGLAGDLAAASRSMESMIASDIIENLGDAFNIIADKQVTFL